MTLYLTDSTSPEEILAAKQSGFVVGAKLYPAGATTHSDAGVTSIDKVWPALEAHGRGRSRAAGARRGHRAAGRRVRPRTRLHRPGAEPRRRSRAESQGRVRAHHDARGRAVRAGRAQGRRRDDHAAAPAAESQCALRGRLAAASLLPAGAEARAGSRGAASRPRRATTRAFSSAPTARRTRCTPRKRPAAAPEFSRRMPRSNCMQKRSNSRAGSTGCRRSPPSAAPISTACRATRKRSS